MKAVAAPRASSPSISSALLMACWPTGLISLSLIGRYYFGRTGLVEAFLGAGLLLPVPLLLWLAYRRRTAWYSLLSPLNDWRALMLFIVWIVGSSFSVLPSEALMLSGLTIVAFFISSAYVRLCTPREMNLGLALYATASALIVMYVTVTGGGAGRAIVGFRLNPNAFGFFAMSAGCFALCWKNPILRYGTIAMAAYPILMVESRASMLGLLVTTGSFVFLGLTSMELYKRIVIALLITGVIGLFWLAPVEHTVRETFALDDPHRGVGTGFTGRTERWQRAIDLFHESPILGVGFRLHTHVLVGEKDVHNGFLAYMAETGSSGVVIALALVGAAVLGSLRTAKRHLDRVMLAATFGYLAHAVFERFIFNVGNPGSLLFILWIVYGLACYRATIQRRLALRPALKHAMIVAN